MPILLASGLRIGNYCALACAGYKRDARFFKRLPLAGTLWDPSYCSRGEKWEGT